MLVLYVDDLFLTGVEVLISQCNRELISKFEMKDLGLMHYYLGLEIWKNHDGIFFIQVRYIINVLQRFGMMDCMSMNTSMVTNLKKIHDCDPNLIEPFMYHKLIGSLYYLVNTRTKIFYAMNMLNQFLVETRPVHQVVVKHILRYLHGTIEYGLRYFSNGELKLHGFNDIDQNGSYNNRKSTSRFYFGLGSIIISWSSRKKTSIPLTTVEDEYIVACLTCSEVVWI